MKKKGTFVVSIVDQENGTWQGQVTWLDRKETKSFRSMLELIRLMDGAVNIEKEDRYVPFVAHTGQLIG